MRIFCLFLSVFHNLNQTGYVFNANQVNGKEHLTRQENLLAPKTKMKYCFSGIVPLPS